MRLLSPIAALALCVFAPSALAGELTVLPPGPVLAGDAATLWMVATDDAGQPAAGLRLRGTASIGTLDAVTETAPGVYRLDYRSAAAAAGQTVQLELRGRGPDREAVRVERRFTLRAPSGPALELSVDNDMLVLGDDDGTTLNLATPPGSHPALGASLGSVASLMPAADGGWTARYLPRAVNFPHVAIVSVTVGDEVVARPIRLAGKVDFPVSAPPGATVLLRIAGREFGPVQAGPDGVAQVPIEVPPGVDIATQVITNDGQVSESALELGIPESTRVSLLPLPGAVPEGAEVQVCAAVVEPTGELDPVTQPQLSTTNGAVSDVERLSAGLWCGSWTAQRPESGPVSVLVTLPGEAEQAHAVDVDIVPALPGSIELSHDPIEGSGPLTVEAIVRDADEHAAGGFEVSVLGGDPVALRDTGRGSYRGTVSITPASRDQLVAVLAEPTGLPPVRLAFTAPRQTIAPSSALQVGVVALDRFGVPVPDVAIELEVADGGGRIEGTVATGEAGIALARYRSPETTGAVHLIARSGGLRADLALAQVSTELDLPGPTDNADWRRTVAWLGAPPPAAEAPAVDAVPEETPAEPEAIPPVASSEPEHETVIRVLGSFVGSSYTYTQDPRGDGGPLLDEAIVVGTENGDGAASPLGYQFSGNAVFGAFPYIGLSATWRNTSYGVTAPAFEGAVAKDSLRYVHAAVVGRLPILLSEDSSLHVGLRVGVESSDFVYYTGNVDARFIEYTTLNVPALALGGEVGAELGIGWVRASFDGSLAYFDDPYATRFALDGGVDLADHLAFTAGLGHTARDIVVTGANSGTELGDLRDRQFHVHAGLGVRF